MRYGTTFEQDASQLGFGSCGSSCSAADLANFIEQDCQQALVRSKAKSRAPRFLVEMQ